MPEREQHRYTVDDLKDAYTPQEFATMANLSRRQTRRLIKLGYIDSVQISPRLYRIPKRAVDAWMEARFPASA